MTGHGITWIVTRGALGARSLGFTLSAPLSPEAIDASFEATFGREHRAPRAWAKAREEGRTRATVIGSPIWVLRESDFRAFDEVEVPPTLELVDTGTGERVCCSLAGFELANEDLDEIPLIRAMRIGDKLEINGGGACPPVRIERVA